MKVNSNKPPDGLDPSSMKRISDRGGAPGGAAGPADSIEISKKGKEAQGIMDSISRLPEMRTDKVNAAAEAVKAGNYKVESGRIAEKMISEMT
ncbi:MAG: flagellar biosynthesis anti-sigma factor FlgM [Nitrospiraceae bacterium]|nr:flagellar biosynthesis anti-sigma factor FlgM [Nitrospiraceae bacterium]